jgi:hypothetical protein
VVARSPEKTEEFVKFTAEAFYKNYHSCPKSVFEMND